MRYGIKISEICGIIFGILIAISIVIGFGLMIKGCQDQTKATTYEFEIIEKYEKLGSRFLSGSETEYRVIYKSRRLYKNNPDSEWQTHDRSIYYSQYRNIKPGYKFKGKSQLFYTYEFN